MQFHSEDGLELLSRFSEKRSLRSINLDDVLFPGDIDSKSVIEIVGGLSTGKTLLLYQFIAKCILPEQHNGVKINGHNVRAILIDTLGHIRVSKMTELLTSMIRNTIVDTQLPADAISLIVNRSLENLTVIGCCNNDQLQLTLHMLEDEFLRDERIAVLAIDNILAYYWQERRKQILSMNQYAKNLVKFIQLRTFRFRIVTIYTRWNEPAEHEVPKYSEPLKGTDVTYRLQLCRNDRTRELFANMQSTKDVKQIRYTIFDSGIKWILQ